MDRRTFTAARQRHYSKEAMRAHVRRDAIAHYAVQAGLAAITLGALVLFWTDAGALALLVGGLFGLMALQECAHEARRDSYARRCRHFIRYGY